MIDLSVLIASTHSRYQTFGRKISDQVWEQYNNLPETYRDRIEIIMLTDNKKMMLGEKRNKMIDIAQGKYVQFIDDDDRIDSEMFRLILDATEFDTDVITFPVMVSLNGEPPKVCHYSIRYTHDENREDHYERLPNHICVVRKELASQVSFPNLVYGEDSGYSKLLRPLLKTEHQIDKVLYFYDWCEQTSETQEHRPGSIRKRPLKPLVDVVMLSKADTPELREMTQLAINSCVAGANSLPVNVMVMEQAPGVRYEHARTVFAGDEFHYNRFANRGAQLGFAPWIVVTNNDVVFHDGWLHQLLAAGHDVVSPKCPHDTRSAHIVTNETGYDNAVHFSGWCFMLRRELWHRIGGFDECVNFWCSDDVVIEQLRAIGVEPMKVPDAVVEHRISGTLDGAPDRDELTWANVEIFNEKYGQHKFENDKRYLAWRLNKIPVDFTIELSEQKELSP